MCSSLFYLAFFVLGLVLGGEVILSNIFLFKVIVANEHLTTNSNAVCVSLIITY